jgi:hypothetical protein
LEVGEVIQKELVFPIADVFCQKLTAIVLLATAEARVASITTLDWSLTPPRLMA